MKIKTFIFLLIISIFLSCNIQPKFQFATLNCTNNTSGYIDITTLNCDCALLLNTGETGTFDLTAESHDSCKKEGVVYYKIYSSYFGRSIEKRKNVKENSEIDDNITNADFN